MIVFAQNFLLLTELKSLESLSFQLQIYLLVDSVRFFSAELAGYSREVQKLLENEFFACVRACARAYVCVCVCTVPRESTVITGISKLKGWPILEVRYLGCKSMKLKKSNGVLKSMILTSKFQIRPLG